MDRDELLSELVPEDSGILDCARSVYSDAVACNSDLFFKGQKVKVFRSVSNGPDGIGELIGEFEITDLKNGLIFGNIPTGTKTGDVLAATN